MKCRYRYCESELPWSINGNRRYCDQECSDAERLVRERDKYDKRKSIISEVNRIEALLRACYNRYGGTPFDINILRELKMNWTILSETLVIDDIRYRVVGSFGYVAFANNTIKIVKI